MGRMVPSGGSVAAAEDHGPATPIPVVPHLAGRTGPGHLPGDEQLAGEGTAAGAVEDQAAGLGLGQDQAEDQEGG